MSEIAIIGTGYVGSVTGACLADVGHRVWGVDKKPEVVERMLEGRVNDHIYEPDLQDMVQRNLAEGRLTFTTDAEEAVANSEIVYLAVPTPQGEDDEADLSYVLAAASEVARFAVGKLVIVDKSTVPVGTAHWVKETVREITDHPIAVLSNPETLREGSAIKDFYYPEQIIIGADDEDLWAAHLLAEIYEPFVRTDPGRVNIMDPFSAEAVKYGINAFLATKLSFANEFAEYCKQVGADFRRVGPALGRDTRIGSQFLLPGPGWGGSCFPKDTRAVVKNSETYGVDLSVIRSAIEANERRKAVLPQRVLEFFEGDIEGKTVALWGLAFKPNTDDVRESPALTIIDVLTSHGANVVAYDPKATRSVLKQDKYANNPRLRFVDHAYDALDGAHALVEVTDWKEFFAFEYENARTRMAVPAVFDGRDMQNPQAMREHGFYYNPMGSPTVDGRQPAAA
jgi:UDPglucose 6-dehydrogenase